MTDNSPRARLNQLLEQLVPSAAKRDQWMEIFRLAKVADLSASWRPPVPLPVREVINSPAKLATARRKLTDLEYEERRLARIPDFKRRAVDDDRLRAVRHEITTLGTEVRLAAHMQGAAA